jgi:hypothetical protein
MLRNRLVDYLRYAVHGERVTIRRPRRRPRRSGAARNWRYRGWIRTLPSVISGMPGAEAAHTGDDGGMSQKASDYTCIPLTAEEHREYHQVGRREFERRHGIDCRELVAELNHAWFAHAAEVQ